MPSEVAYIALGSNLGDSLAILNGALAELQALSTASIVRSSFWRTSPVDCPPGSDPFVNAVAAIVPPLDETPESLIEKLQALERKFGRRPKLVLNESRPLDLDLIAYGDQQRNTPALILPHPRAHLRKFVLQPLSEIAPQLVLPGQTQTVENLLANLKTDERIIHL